MKFFRERNKRVEPRDDVDRFERFFIGLYTESPASVIFFDVRTAPPRVGRPAAECCLSWEQFIGEVISAYRDRNDPPFEWAE